MQVNSCLRCGRDFIATKCPQHCTNACCEGHACENTRRNTRAPRAVIVRCMVCHRPAKDFERFAPCTKDCKGAVFFRSSRADPGAIGAGMFARRWVTDCHLREELPSEDWHQPSDRPRRHIKYCSLRCYNSVAFGHETRRLEGNRRRARRQEAKDGTVPGWRNRYRTEKGYFREYQRSKKIRQSNLMRYGDDRSEVQLRESEALRKAAENDPDFLEIFGPGAGA